MSTFQSCVLSKRALLGPPGRTRAHRLGHSVPRIREALASLLHPRDHELADIAVHLHHELRY